MGKDKYSVNSNLLGRLKYIDNWKLDNLALKEQTDLNKVLN